MRTVWTQDLGHAYLELLIALPFLLLVGMSGFELTRYVSASQAAATLSRELASAAYKCAAEQSTLTDCLLERHRDVQDFAHQMFEGAETKVAIVKFLGDRSQCASFANSGGSITGDVQLLGKSGPREFPSRFSFPDGAVTMPIGQMQGATSEVKRTMCMNGFSVFAEANISYTPSHILLAQFLQTLGSADFYDATIL